MAKKRKKVSGWKNKKIYSILAPEKFDKQEIGTTLTDDPARLNGRTVNVTLGELTKERSKNYLNLVFEVYSTKADKALTKFKKFFIPTGYLRSKVRKHTKKIDYTRDVSLSDVKANVKVMVLSRHNVSEVQKSEIKAHIDELLASYSEEPVDEFVHKVLFGKLGTEIYKKVKVVCPILRVEVYRVTALD